MNIQDVKIEESWKGFLRDEFAQPYFQAVRSFLHQEKEIGKIIYPPGQQIFRAFELTPVDKLKVIILGQDPYHNPGEAMGLCFSVPAGVRIPPSLVNIFKELKLDLGCTMPVHGDLTAWANQGVLLLNAFLTVEQNKPLSHSKIGWQTFTDAVISGASQRLDGKVFMLWGNFAKAKAPLIDEKKHLILTSAHPSPLAGNAFFNNHHFSKANDYLVSKGTTAVNWQIT
ncbi:MAG: uracil-DNA glycosylase [Saprospiraceae bacterium]|nr:uracil-DNA glycosylase [Saprospiraceae bacterium]